MRITRPSTSAPRNTRPRRITHRAWLAEGPADPREQFVRALVAACADAKTVLAYNAPFEKRCIAGLIEAVPRFAAKLSNLSDRISDLLPIVRNHVYHPNFLGSFSIKDVLPALVPGIGYEDLEIQNGATASSTLESLLLHGDSFTISQTRAMRRKLLRYCERDTFAMVRLFERLQELASGQTTLGARR